MSAAAQQPRDEPDPAANRAGAEARRRNRLRIVLRHLLDMCRILAFAATEKAGGGVDVAACLAATARGEKRGAGETVTKAAGLIERAIGWAEALCARLCREAAACRTAPPPRRARQRQREPREVAKPIPWGEMAAALGMDDEETRAKGGWDKLGRDLERGVLPEGFRPERRVAPARVGDPALIEGLSDEQVVTQILQDLVQAAKLLRRGHDVLLVLWIAKDADRLFGTAPKPGAKRDAPPHPHGPPHAQGPPRPG